MNNRRLSQLIRSVRELEVFLRPRNKDFWADKLATVANALETESKRQSARIELDSFFGGMGSLNDLAFSDDVEQEEFGQLADDIFKQNKLLTAGVRDKLGWRLDEWLDKNELPPRIRNSFAK
jgi:hypothetical protein